jgi:hypothetical protein
MRHTATAAVLTAILTVGLTACNEPTVTTTPDTPRKTAEKTAAPAPKKKTARIGDTLTLEGQEPGQQLAVTLKKWADPAKSSDEYITPQDGHRWVAGRFELKNTGTKTYRDSPSGGAQVADTDGQRFHATLANGNLTVGPEMTWDLKLPVGEKALGWIVFEIPKGSKARSVQFTMNSGFADQTGQWTIKK